MSSSHPADPTIDAMTLDELRVLLKQARLLLIRSPPTVDVPPYTERWLADKDAFLLSFVPTELKHSR